ncbi:MAG: hypothetical protein IKU23_07610 [Clostridia bacterium]|nr:hypothetical protein [Clostridia bacterium]
MSKFISILCIFLVLAIATGVMSLTAFADDATPETATADTTGDNVSPGDSANQTMWMVLIILSVLVIGVCATQRRFD